LSEEGLQRNVQRLLEYKSKLILYPRRSVSDKKLKKYTAQGGLDDTPKEQRKNVTQAKGDLLPHAKVQPVLELREITEADTKKKDAWYQVRSARKEARAVSYQVKKKRAAKEAIPVKSKKE
jgi:large subunit ribosomal protein L13e